ncbi:MAG: hypothetical protein PVG81_12230 [Desulfobacterales bacterium]|jgi:hypothetical protein
MEKNIGSRERSLSRHAMTCRHFVDGRVEMPKLCLRRRDCSCCAFDQWLDDTETERGILKRSASREFFYAAA